MLNSCNLRVVAGVQRHMKHLLCLFLLTISLRAADRAPNIVFILADDLGYTDVACFGSKYYETPNIDKLAQQGMKLTRFHQCQNCQPTRAALMSGQYAPRTGIYTVGGIERFDWKSRPLRPVDNVTALPLEKITIAQTMKQAGYATGMFGKWHLGQSGEYHPGQRGFDEAIVSMGKHFDFVTQPKVEYPKDEYLADFLTDKAVDFIQRHKDAPSSSTCRITAFTRRTMRKMKSRHASRTSRPSVVTTTRCMPR